MKGRSKLIFANQLRGIAALLVVLSHLCCVFWGAKGAVSAYTGAPPADGGQPWIGDYINSYYWNSGAVGVAIFFTISGFVICSGKLISSVLAGVFAGGLYRCHGAIFRLLWRFSLGSR